MTINTLELRNYLLKPNVLEHFIDYFEAHFIFSQEAAQMPVLGQFRVINEPNHFVWLRGFNDMQTRLEGLQNFYGGPVWEKFGPVANDMMLEWHNVHLLHLLSSITELTCGLSADVVAADLAAGTISPYTGVIVIDLYQAEPGKRSELVDKFQTQVVPAAQNEAIQIRGYFVAEMRKNEFTRLPVIQNEDELAVITAYESEEACREQRDKVTPHINTTLSALLSKTPETLLLSPTLRSPLRYMRK
jgi:heme-degrading monooxygenase HmoA